MFIIIRGFASRASRTLDWTRTLTFWLVCGFWLTKNSSDWPLRYRNQQICLWFATMYNAAKTEWKHNTRLILTWGSCRLLSFCCYVYLVGSLLSLELGYIQTRFQKSWDTVQIVNKNRMQWCGVSNFNILFRIQHRWHIKCLNWENVSF